MCGTLDPFPFKTGEFTTRVPVRRLSGSRWPDPPALLRAWESGTPDWLEVTLGAA